MRDSVEAFACQMENRLKENEHKGGWGECSIDFLVLRLRLNLAHLRIALNEGVDRTQVQRHTADIANYAMMISDKWR